MISASSEEINGKVRRGSIDGPYEDASVLRGDDAHLAFHSRSYGAFLYADHFFRRAFGNDEQLPEWTHPLGPAV